MTIARQDRDAAAPFRRDAKAEGAGPAIEKFPQFAASLQAFAEKLSESLAPICGPGVSASIEQTGPTTAFAFLDAHEGEPAAVMLSQKLEARALLVVDPGASEILISSMFGLNPSTDSSAARIAAARERTALETRLLAEFSKTLIATLEEAFNTTAPFDLAFDSFNPIAGASLLGRNDQATISVSLAVKTLAGVFGLIVALPRSLTGRIAELYAKGPDPSTLKPDPQWKEDIQQRVSQAHMTLSAILDEFPLTLGEVAHLEIGQVIPLSGAGEGRIRIECSERGVFVCTLGERNERYALEVEDILPLPPETLPPGL